MAEQVLTQPQALSLRQSGDVLHLAIAGEWRVTDLSKLDRALGPVEVAHIREIRVNVADLSILDFSAAWRLREFLERASRYDAKVTFEGGEEPEQLRLITECLARAPYRPPAAEIETGIEPVEALGRHIVR